MPAVSTTTTRSPVSARKRATEQPASPAPTTTVSACFLLGDVGALMASEKRYAYASKDHRRARVIHCRVAGATEDDAGRCFAAARSTQDIAGQEA
jgi:hypothetical protein